MNGNAHFEYLPWMAPFDDGSQRVKQNQLRLAFLDHQQTHPLFQKTLCSGSLFHGSANQLRLLTFRQRAKPSLVSTEKSSLRARQCRRSQQKQRESLPPKDEKEA
jgi:hypothetical protein